jgi:ubiquinone/menaquinone biosynthesis C-methylase UbiE
MSMHAPVRRIYDSLAKSYDHRWRHYLDATLSLAIRPLELTGGENILDIACGTGELERRLLSCWPDIQIMGLDLSLNMLRVAATKGVGDKTSWIQGEAAHLPVQDHQFDYVICVNAFHFFRSPAETLQELRRVLRHGGSLIIVDWCDDYLSCRLSSLWLRLIDPAFYQTYTVNACKQVLEGAGFEVQTATRSRIDWFWGLMRVVSRPSSERVSSHLRTGSVAVGGCPSEKGYF